jgi:superoxide dismutase, Fe-Mn family
MVDYKLPPSITPKNPMTLITRRQWIETIGTTTSAIVLTSLLPQAAQAAEPDKTTKLYATLPALPYAYDALAPFIDERTMTIHHDLHHGAYVKNLNAALDKFPKYKEKPIEDLFRILNKLPEEIRRTVRNNGGGHYNHSLFWESMGPKTAVSEPVGELSEAIVKDFGSIEAFKTKFVEAGMQRFGSGWVWLAITRKGNLAISTTPNQDNPCMVSDIPILGNDLWEHAYYLTYQNRRAEYLAQWWNVVNWTAVNDRYKKAIA